MFDNIEAVIFDLDGTVIDSMWMWEAIDVEYFARYNVQFTHDYQLAIEGMSFHETAVFFKEKFNLPDSIEKMKADWNDMAWHKYEYEVKPKPGVVDFLKKLKDKGIPCGIATSNSRELCMLCLNANDLTQYFSEIHTANEVARGKPSPDIYLLVAEKLGVKPANCLVFEDVYQGICAGNNAGMITCAVADDYSEQFWDMKIKAADYNIHDFLDDKITGWR